VSGQLPVVKSEVKQRRRLLLNTAHVTVRPRFIAAAVFIVSASSAPVNQPSGVSVSDSAGIRIAITDTPVAQLKEIIATTVDQVVTVGVVSGTG
jgi:hypothetical protein